MASCSRLSASSSLSSKSSIRWRSNSNSVGSGDSRSRSTGFLRKSLEAPESAFHQLRGTATLKTAQIGNGHADSGDVPAHFLELVAGDIVLVFLIFPLVDPILCPVACRRQHLKSGNVAASVG